MPRAPDDPFFGNSSGKPTCSLSSLVQRMTALGMYPMLLSQTSVICLTELSVHPLRLRVARGVAFMV